MSEEIAEAMYNVFFSVDSGEGMVEVLDRLAHAAQGLLQAFCVAPGTIPFKSSHGGSIGDILEGVIAMSEAGFSIASAISEVAVAIESVGDQLSKPPL